MSSEIKAATEQSERDRAVCAEHDADLLARDAVERCERCGRSAADVKYFDERLLCASCRCERLRLLMKEATWR